MKRYVQIVGIGVIMVIFIGISLIRGNFQMAASFFLLLALSGATYFVNLLQTQEVNNSSEEIEWKRLYFLTFIITVILAVINYLICKFINFPFPVSLIFGITILPILSGIFTIRLIYLTASEEGREKLLSFKRQFLILFLENLVIASALLSAGLIGR